MTANASSYYVLRTVKRSRFDHQRGNRH